MTVDVPRWLKISAFPAEKKGPVRLYLNPRAQRGRVIHVELFPGVICDGMGKEKNIVTPKTFV